MALRRHDLELAAFDDALQRNLVPDLGEEALRRGDLEHGFARRVQLDLEGRLRGADDLAGELALAVAHEVLEQLRIRPLLVLGDLERSLQDDVEAVLLVLARPVRLASDDELDGENIDFALELVDGLVAAGHVGDVHESVPALRRPLEDVEAQALLGGVENQRIDEGALALTGRFVDRVHLADDALFRGLARRDTTLNAAVLLPEVDEDELADGHADGGFSQPVLTVGVRAGRAVDPVQLERDGAAIGARAADQRVESFLDRRIVPAGFGLDQENGHVAGGELVTDRESTVALNGGLDGLCLDGGFGVRHDCSPFVGIAALQP